MSGNTVIVTDASFEDDLLRADRPVIVDFWAEWCMPCRLVAPVLEEIAEEQAGRLIAAKLNVDENPATADTYQVQSIPLMGVYSSRTGQIDPRRAAEAGHYERARGILPMTAHVDPAGPAEAGQQLARADAVPSNTGETRHLQTGLGVAVKHALLTGPVPQLHVAHRSVTGISEPSTPTEQEIMDEIRVDAGLGAWAAHGVLPVPGGAS